MYFQTYFDKRNRTRHLGVTGPWQLANIHPYQDTFTSTARSAAPGGGCSPLKNRKSPWEENQVYSPPGTWRISAIIHKASLFRTQGYKGLTEGRKGVQRDSGR
jgi:hypothetical protein